MRLCFYTILLVVIILIGSCANPQPPSGGPKDTTPPTLIKSAPAQRETNFSGKEIELIFDKYMDKNKVIENLQISPAVQTINEWSGKKLSIKFSENLQKNTTYILTIGTEATDYLQNKLDNPIILVFSTGELIDTGIIQGKVYDNSPKGISIFAYHIDHIDVDTLDARHTKPNYCTQAGIDGQFKILGLKEGKYRIIAIRDVFKNNLYDEGIEDFGVASQDFILINGKSEFVRIKIRPPEDTIPPMLYSAEQMAENLIIANFSEEIDTASIKEQSFILIDSIKNDSIKILSAFVSPNSQKQIWIFTKDTLETNKIYHLFVNQDTALTLRDTVKNPIPPKYSYTKFLTATEHNPQKFELVKIIPKDSAVNVSVFPQFTLVFNKPLSPIKELNNILSLENQAGKKIELKYDYIKNNIIAYSPKEELQNFTQYTLKINFGEISSLWKEKIQDTILNITFQTEDLREYVSISGIIRNNEFCLENTILNIYDEQNKIIKSQKIADTLWSFNKIKPGEITFEMFCDLNKNNKYDFGKIYPFKFSEPFYIFENKIRVKPRWSIENIILKIPTD